MWKVLIGIVVATVVITASVVLFRNRHHLLRPDVARVGGTRLVVACEGKPGPDAVAAALAKRFDPTGSEGIIVRAAGDGLEIDVPNGSNHDENVERVKRLLARPGRLRFGVLAHQDDDGPALEAARKWLTPANRKALEDAHDRGLPLPRLRDAAGEDRFPSKRPGEPPSHYSWVWMNVSAAAALTATSIHVAPRHNEQWPVFHDAGRPGWSGPLYFVVMREPAASEEVGNAEVTRARVQVNGHGPHATQLNLQMDGQGRSRLNDFLTRQLSGPRNVALALDDEVLLYFLAATEMSRSSFNPIVEDRPQGEDRAALVRAPLPAGASLSLKEEQALSPRR